MMLKRIVASWLLVALALGPTVSLEAQVTADADLEKGVLQVQSGDFEAALITLDGVVRRLAGQRGAASALARGQVYLGMAYLGLDQEPAARARFQDAWRADTGMKPSATEFPPRVLRLLEEARKQVLSASAAKTTPEPQPSPPPTAEAAGSSATAPKKSGSKLPLILLGAGAAAAGIAVAAGGGGSSGAKAPTATPATPATPAPPQVLVQTSWTGLAQSANRAFDFSTPAAGTLRITVNWTFTTSDVDVYLTTPTCTTSFSPSGICTVLASAELFAKPEVINTSVSSGGNYRVIVRYFDGTSATESGTVEVLYTRQ